MARKGCRSAKQKVTQCNVQDLAGKVLQAWQQLARPKTQLESKAWQIAAKAKEEDCGKAEAEILIDEVDDLICTDLPSMMSMVDRVVDLYEDNKLTQENKVSVRSEEIHWIWAFG